MAEFDQTSSSHKCPRCGAELPGTVPAELCPKCLLQAGIETQPVSDPGGAAAPPATGAKSRGLPQPGEQLGHYRIVRLLGEGGMGAVFEAEDLESGRRVALKVLSHMLDSPEARERFFREGRLAASINHPNSVYVFGTEEIGGTPVIAMELVAGGTLQERVRAQGPLPVGEAVDGVLQIIAGLEAAQRIGILHRDIKPSNCFRDADGTVKIGDFGLSISTAVRLEPALTSSGAFLGTPAFCSPEQLRGDELNARSDMYAVGATLFYLLTGRTPFEAKNVVQLLATVLEQRAPSPRQFRAAIPQGLARVILRCLEKQPGERFRSYQELADALAPFSSAAPTPATLGLRFLAGALDGLTLSVVSFSLLLAAGGSPLDFMNLATLDTRRWLGWIIATVTGTVLYYAWLEGRWGASLGKAICRLRVVQPDKSPPGIGRAGLRAVLYVLAPVLPYWLVCGLVYGGSNKAMMQGSSAVQILMGFSYYLVLAGLFCTMRRRNGFAALHDLITRTRVISRVALAARPVLAATETMPPAVEGKFIVGPYHVLETLEQSADAEWLLGYDLRLLRKVWIRRVPQGTPPVPASWRSVGRVGRLRWLAGRRAAEENWDAFEAATGTPLVQLIQTPQPWRQARYWLCDLAGEISAAEKDATRPTVLALDRVWITADGRAKLLDFPAPGLPRERVTIDEPPAAAGRPLQFLAEVAAAALAGWWSGDPRTAPAPAGPPPWHARVFLEGLPQLPDAEAVTRALRPLLQRAPEVSRWRRAAIVAGCLVFPLFAGCCMIFGTMFLERWNRSQPGLMELNMLLQSRAGMNSWLAKKQPHPSDREFAIYIAHHYRAVITNDTAWSSAFGLSMVNGEARRFAEQSVAEHPAPTEKEIAEADQALKSHLPKADDLNFMKQPWFPLVAGAASLVIYVGIPALIAALSFRGGLVLLLAGVTFVRRDGRRASRLRVFGRALLAWGSMALPLILCVPLGMCFGPFGATLVSTLLLCALTIVSVALPKRGLPDRLAGTWPVPR